MTVEFNSKETKFASRQAAKSHKPELYKSDAANHLSPQNVQFFTSSKTSLEFKTLGCEIPNCEKDKAQEHRTTI